MARTPYFKSLSQTLRRAYFLNKNPHLKNALIDYEGGLKEKLSSPAEFNRRDFLKSSLTLGIITLPAVSALAKNLKKIDRIYAFNDDPVIILGGGLSGLTTTYRLNRAGVNTVLYEGQSRLGGRVQTRSHFNKDGMFCEIGGELIDTSHNSILSLASELGLSVDNFRQEDANFKKQHYFFRNQHYFEDDLTEACKPLISRLMADSEKVFYDLQNPIVTYDKHKPSAVTYDQISVAKYIHSLSEVEPWVRDLLNVAYATEFGLDTEEQSSLNLLNMLAASSETNFNVYGESDESLRIKGGNSRLIEALVSAITPHTTINLEHRLVKIADTGSKLALTFSSHGKTQTVQAAKVICTLPFSTLRDVEGVKYLSLNPVKQHCIDNLGYATNAKYMLGFNKKYWRENQGQIPPSNGSLFTDLPCQSFWETSRRQKGNSGILTAYLGGKAGVDDSTGKVDSILSNLEKIHPGIKSHYDSNYTLVRWSQHPFTKGSYTCPKLGQYTKFMGSAKEIELNGKLMFAGEHVSEKSQGYLNGAVESANAAAQILINS